MTYLCVDLQGLVLSALNDTRWGLMENLVNHVFVVASSLWISEAPSSLDSNEIESQLIKMIAQRLSNFLTDCGKTLSAEPQLLCNFISKADGGALDRVCWWWCVWGSFVLTPSKLPIRRLPILRNELSFSKGNEKVNNVRCWRWLLPHRN